MKKDGRVLSRKEALRIMGAGVSVPFLLGRLQFEALAAEGDKVVNFMLKRNEAITRLTADVGPPFLIRPQADMDGVVIGGQITGVDDRLATGAFQDGDIILKVDGRSIAPVDKETVEAEEKLVLEKVVRGQSISVELLRKGKPLKYNFKFQ